MEAIGVSTSLQLVLHRLDSVAADCNASNLPMRTILIKLAATLIRVAGVIDDAEKKGTVSPAVNHWLRLLQDVLFEVDDLIDEVQLEVQRHLPRGGSFFFSRFNPFLKECKLVEALKQTLSTLEYIVRDIPQLGFVSYAKLTSVSRGTTSHPYACCRSEILGRERDKMEIKDAILNRVAAAEGVSVVAIVGMGGIGKTSLAQLVYNDPSIRSLFEITLWVHDGDRDDIFYALHQMRMQAMEENHLNLNEDCRSFSQLRMELYELLGEKRFILVVDDTWSPLLFENFFGELLHSGSKGSVIIVTTRSQGVAHEFRAYLVHYLSCLSEDVCCQLFAKYAFASNGLQVRPEFDALARRIVRLCRGHPMVVKMVGTYLYNKDNMQQWTEVLETLQGQGFEGIHGVFKFISDQLPSYLKLPFCTLSLQQVSSVEELLCLWMALGFVSSDDPNQQPEYIGRKYLRELAESALCPDVEYAPGGVVRDIKIHDLVNDMATETAHEQGFRALRLRYKTSTSIDKNIKYLTMEEDDLADIDLPVKLRHANKLRLFMLFPGKQASAHRLMNIISGFTSLRVLGLGGCDIEILPDSIGQLKHLRYLDVAGNELLNSLPDSICNLWHLQTLLLHGCHQLESLPSSIGNLQNLRYLTLTTSQESLQEEIGQLTSLRTLGLSSCRRLVSLPSSLKNLKNLQTLGIVDCPEIDLLASSSVEALKGMDDIDTLLLSGLPEFERLPPNLGTPSVVLKHLLIQFSMKLTETAWINQFLFLHSLTIEECLELSTLMADGASQFNNMAELVIRGCPRLGDTTWIRRFASLRSLIIDDCRNLVALDAGFTVLKKLERLEIRGCPVLIKRIQILGGLDSSYISHVRVVELDGVPIHRIRRVYGKVKNWYQLSESRCSTQEDDTNCSSIMDVASVSSHLISNRVSASEISENAS